MIAGRPYQVAQLHGPSDALKKAERIETRLSDAWLKQLKLMSNLRMCSQTCAPTPFWQNGRQPYEAQLPDTAGHVSHQKMVSNNHRAPVQAWDPGTKTILTQAHL